MGKEKKEIGKLLELLNEYEPFICGDGTYTDNHWSYVLDGHSAVYPKSVAKNVIISKSYGFIEWLVREDKIEWEKVYENLKDYEVEIRIRAVKKLALSEKKSLWYLELLMLLAIQDEPIEFLCSLLK